MAEERFFDRFGDESQARSRELYDSLFAKTAEKISHHERSNTSMATITPTIGRVVLYWPDKSFSGCRPDAGQPLPALIARVWNDTSINVGGFDANGVPFSAGSVYLVPADGEPLNRDAHYATWMPYQKGQAAKTEALEKAAAGG